jgi:PPOX class probable F420-dependent enzyme
MKAKQRSAKKLEPKASRPHMAGYGLPKDTKGLLPWRWAVDRLKKSRQYWIATTRPDGAPHVMVVWALWFDGAVCFSTGSKSRKAQNLEKNPRCVICNEKADEAVVVEGVAEKFRDPERVKEFVAQYERKYKFDMSSMGADMISLKEPVFAVRPRVAFGLFEKKFATTATRWKFGK